MTEHTPLPWRSRCSKVYGAPCKGHLANGPLLFNATDTCEEDHANAAHIVACVNSHDKLEEAVNMAIGYIGCMPPQTTGRETMIAKLKAALEEESKT